MAKLTDALLALFNGVFVENKEPKNVDDKILKKTIKHGYVLDPAIDPDKKLLKKINEIVGLSGKKMNRSFHKSWKVVRDSSIEDLVTQQILHYITTYGFASVGIYDKDTVYIPAEKLKVPKPVDINLTVIKAMSRDDVLESVLAMGCGVALSQESLDNLMVVIEKLKFDSDIIEKIKNRELKSKLYEHFDLCPSDPVEYLRFVVHKLTGESLLIKNNELIEKIKGSVGMRNKLFQSVLNDLYKKAPDDLASIFLRFKPIFLALKSISENKTFFNRLRKMANKMHKPLPEDFLNSVTAHIKHNKLDMDRLKKKLDGATIFRKIRLAYALNFRLNCPEAIVYRVRNGRGWASEFDWSECDVTYEALALVKQSIADSLSVDGQTFYIPKYIHYTIPATEKQFIGHIPNGSYVSSVKELIFGVHWKNVDLRSIDIDLALLSVGGKVGWDGAYRNGSDIMFSGDVTDAPDSGASELFYIKKGRANSQLITANYFNYDSNYPVPCKFFVADEKPEKMSRNYMVDPNNVVVTTSVTIDKKQNVFGFIDNVDGENRVYFTNVSVGKAISSSWDRNSQNSQKYMCASVVNSITLDEILKLAGANIVSEKPDGEYVDLSPELLDKSTILKILS